MSCFGRFCRRLANSLFFWRESRPPPPQPPPPPPPPPVYYILPRAAPVRNSGTMTRFAKKRFFNPPNPAVSAQIKEILEELLDNVATAQAGEGHSGQEPIVTINAIKD